MDTHDRARLIARHTKYAYRLAVDYCDAVDLSFHDREDVGQQALVGLIEAAEDFDPSILPLADFRLYARHRIRRRIIEHISVVLRVRKNETTIGLDMPESVEPVERAQAADEVWDAIRRLNPFEAYIVVCSDGVDGRRPQSARQISEECGLSPHRIRAILAEAHRRMAEGLAARRRA